MAEYTVSATAFVANNLSPFNTDQWRRVAEFLQTFCRFVGDEMSVCEDLEISIGVCFENLKQVVVHKGLAPEQPEERVAHGLCFIEHAIHRVDINCLLLGRDIDPASLAAQVAAVDDRYIQVRGEELSAFQTPFVFLNSPQLKMLDF